MTKLWTWMAWHLPERLVYWATIRLMANATTGKYSNQATPDLLAIEALSRW